jgi:hypothetical protein
MMSKLCSRCNTRKTRNKGICGLCIQMQCHDLECQATCAMLDVEAICNGCGNVLPLLHPCEYCQDDLDEVTVLLLSLIN